MSRAKDLQSFSNYFEKVPCFKYMQVSNSLHQCLVKANSQIESQILVHTCFIRFFDPPTLNIPRT